ncbi:MULTISPECIES: DUF3055 domain-containing protein [Exiguobacterium]|uniref:Protein of uncharacterized function (DUF3055) n=1 Tax=Exiguobacterium aurantiacum TaxID=33987 RepID=A0A377FVZ4_9BACL|nr:MULTISPECIES: DUF3055 domain-containing protein [Exiguobacterium]STO08595.1 Protein of uncharacterised function (DUF3055) [Exiguobacterium aurantiacum]
MAFDEELLYTVSETSRVRFTGIETEMSRYDFGFVYTHQFMGKVLVVCMQTGQSALLDMHALEEPRQLYPMLGIALRDTDHVAEFLRLCLEEKDINHDEAEKSSLEKM